MYSRPELKTPPPLTPEGQVVQPIPEKSWFQKYWFYIAIFFFALSAFISFSICVIAAEQYLLTVLTGPPDEEGKQGGDGGGGRRQA